MEIELIQNYINNILTSNHIVNQVWVYSDHKNIIKIAPFSIFSTIYYQNQDKFKEYIEQILNYVINKQNLGIDISTNIEVHNNILIITINQIITSTLPMENIANILYMSNYKDIKSFCSTNKNIQQICIDQSFWRSKYVYDYDKQVPEFIKDVDKDFYAKLGYIYYSYNTPHILNYNDGTPIKVLYFTTYKITIGLFITQLIILIDDKFDTYIINMTDLFTNERVLYIKGEQISIPDISLIPVNKKLKYITSNKTLSFIDMDGHIYYIKDNRYDVMDDLIQEITQNNPISNIKAKHVELYDFSDQHYMAIIDENNKLWINYDMFGQYIEFTHILNNIKNVKLGETSVAKDYDNMIIFNMNSTPTILKDTKFYWQNGQTTYDLKNNNYMITDNANLMRVLQAPKMYDNTYYIHGLENIYIIDNHSLDTSEYIYLFKYKDGRIKIYDDYADYSYDDTENIVKEYNPILLQVTTEESDNILTVFISNKDI